MSLMHMLHVVAKGQGSKSRKNMLLLPPAILACYNILQGLVQIDMLKTIEQMTGKSISELFDWVVGTSTGGILALGMIYGEDQIPVIAVKFANCLATTAVLYLLVYYSEYCCCVFMALLQASSPWMT